MVTYRALGASVKIMKNEEVRSHMRLVEPTRDGWDGRRSMAGDETPAGSLGSGIKIETNSGQIREL